MLLSVDSLWISLLSGALMASFGEALQNYYLTRAMLQHADAGILQQQQEQARQTHVGMLGDEWEMNDLFAVLRGITAWWSCRTACGGTAVLRLIA